MERRILLVDDSEAVVTALRRDLGEDRVVDAAPPADAAACAAETRYGAAVVRGTAGPVTIAALRQADPHLPVIVVFLDRRERTLHPGVEGDAVLVGPLTASAVVAACDLAVSLRAQAERATALESRLSHRPVGGKDLEFLKRLLFVEVKRSRRYAYPVSLILLSLDGWDDLAPRLEGQVRTGLLAEILGIATGHLRDIDLAVPFSEERLVVLLPHTREEGALRVARRLCGLVRDRAGTPRLTASAGVATHGGDGTVSFGNLVKRAADALARARASGGDRAEPADPAKKRSRISIG
jgi:diguanylate cyclase (GGDEF)-like protein